MINILEFVYENNLKPVGGPNGYVYNMINGLKSSEVKIHTLPSSENYNVRKRILVPGFLKSILKIFYEKKKIKKINEGNEIISNINNYDIIHFHDIMELYSHRNALKNYHGKVVLTTHSPIPHFAELYENYFTKLMKIFGGKKRLNEYKQICEKALYLADYIIFPCETADDGYSKYWPEYSTIKKDNIYKYRYILTGCVEKKPSINPDVLRNELNLGESFIVSYAGRHNYSKGYDILKEIGKKVLKDNNCKFIICGNQGPFYGLKDSNWIEIGWTKDADSYINMSDIFLLPNRETYFDLVLLEVLSLGKIILTSNTGGNKIFSNYDCGVFLYNSLDEAVTLLNRIKGMTIDERNELGRKNKKLYDKYFSNIIFSNSYIELYKSIYEENDKYDNKKNNIESYMENQTKSC